MNIHSMYTIALFANSTYSIVFFFYTFYHLLTSSGYSPFKPEWRPHGTKIYLRIFLTEPGEHGAHQQTQIKY